MPRRETSTSFKPGNPGGPGPGKGNQNSMKGRKWREALHKASVRLFDDRWPDYEGDTALEKAAVALFRRAVDGEVTAIKELGDRFDGKSHQSVSVEADVHQTVDQTGEITLHVITDKSDV